MTVNGAYFGRTDTFPRHADVCAKDEVFVEFHPENALPVGFFLTEKLRFDPPEKCEVYLLPDGIALYVKDFTPCDFSLKVLLQEKRRDVTVTVYRQGGLQVCVEGEKETFVKDLPPSFSLNALQEAGNFFLLSLKEAFCLIDKQAETRLYERYETFLLENGLLRALLPLQDKNGSKAKCVWDLSKADCPKVEFTLLQPKEQAENTLLAYAFFESVLLGCDYLPFLAEPLQKEAEKIKDFLGDFTEVVPCDEADACLLVYPKKERLYQVKRFRILTEAGKITDIQG